MDVAASKVVYSGRFGCEMEDDAGGGAIYTTWRIDDDAVCGLFEMSEDMRAYSTRAAWPC